MKRFISAVVVTAGTSTAVSSLGPAAAAPVTGPLATPFATQDAARQAQVEQRAHAPGGRIRVADLRVESLTDPIGIDVRRPLLSWKVRNSPGQVAYQVRAARNLADPGDASAMRVGDKVSAQGSFNVPLTMLSLRSRDRVTWQVRVWDRTGRVSPWSRPATFEMGLLDESDWSARWIENAAYDYTRPGGGETPLPVFGRAFRAGGQVASARLYMTGLGMYAATLNGQDVSDAVLEPGQTSYRDEVSYRTYDVTEVLRRGRNVIGVETGSGAYQRVKTPGRYFFGNTLEQYTVYGEPKVIAQLELTYRDGSRKVVASDDSWRTALGPTTFSSWWSGEEYDARRVANAPTSPAALEGAGWSQASPVTLSATTTPTATTPLHADPRPPVKVMRTVSPTAVADRGNGVYTLDFGANLSGWPRISLDAPAGTTVTMIPSELANADGSLNVRSTGIRNATDQIAYRYTTRGRGTETWHPRFTYNGFRYLEVRGLPTAPTAETVRLDVVHADNRQASRFSSSDELLDQIHAMTTRSTEGNMMSVLTDCPDREKGPYTGDNLHNIDALLTQFDMAAYQPQLVRNMATAQRKPGDESPGLIANIAPEFHRVLPTKLTYPQGIIQFLDEVNWGGAIIRIPWKLYETYGDTRTMELYYDNMVAWLDYEAANRAANGGDIPGLGDWVASDNTTPMQLVIYAGYYSSADEMSKIAGVLGKDADEAKYRALADELATEFNRRWRHVDATGVYYGSDSQASNAMALDAGLVGEADRDAVVERLVASVRRAGNHMTTGSTAHGPLFRALQAAGRDDVIYDMVVNPTAPGYGYLATHGHTTLAERFDGGGSQNHHFLGQVDDWFVSGIAGIRQAPGSVAYRRLVIAPRPVGGLTRASGRYETPYGTVRSSWGATRTGLVLRVTVPSGTRARVEVPAQTGQQVIGRSAGSTLRPADRADGVAVFTVPAGVYRFTAQDR